MARDHPATKANDWMVGMLGPLFRTAGHTVRRQHGVTASAGQRHSDVEIRSYLQDAADRRSLVFDLSMTHYRFGSSSHVMATQQTGMFWEQVIATQPIGLVLFQERCILPVAEEQSRTRGSQSGGVEDQPRVAASAGEYMEV